MVRGLLHAATIWTWPLLPASVRRARVRRRLDRWVMPFETLAARPRPFPGRVLFTHIPKAGGTTLEHLLAKNHPPNGTVLINSENLFLHPMVFGRFGGLPRVVMGHHKLSQPLYMLIDHRTAHVTILREPVSRVLSHYDYLRVSPNHRTHRTVREMTVEQFAASRVTPELCNGQTLRLAGMLPRVLSSRFRAPASALASAKENLERRFSFFGLTERYGEFLLMAARLLGWRDVFCEPRNVSKQRTQRDAAMDRAIEIIRERNALDIELYDFARALFQRRLDALGITPQDAARYERLNRRHADMCDRVVRSAPASRPVHGAPVSGAPSDDSGG